MYGGKLAIGIGPALALGGNLPFLLCFTLYLRQFPSTSPRGAYICRGLFSEFCVISREDITSIGRGKLLKTRVKTDTVALS